MEKIKFPRLSWIVMCFAAMFLIACDDNEEIVTIEDHSVVSVTDASADMVFTVKGPAGEHGICWSSITSAPTVENDKISTGRGSGSVTETLTGLTKSTHYTARAYAYGGNAEVYYGPPVYFTTATEQEPDSDTPIVSTGSASALFKYGFSIDGGRIVSAGKSAVTTAGYCYSETNTTPDINDKIITVPQKEAGDMDEVSWSVEKPGTRYYVRAFATNGNGTGYGETVVMESRPDYLTITSDGSPTAPPAPYFNSLRCYWLPPASGGASTETLGMGKWQLDLYDGLNAAFQNSGRYFSYHWLLFTSNNAPDGDAGIGEGLYLLFRHYYLSGTTHYAAQINFRVDIDENGYLTFRDEGAPNGNYTGRDAAVQAYFTQFVDYLESDKFKLEYQYGHSGDELILHPVGDPDKFLKFTTIRVYGLTYVTPW